MNFIEANGVSLRYAVEGVGKPIVLIHEMGGTMESWGSWRRCSPPSAAWCATTRAARGFRRRSAASLKIDTMTDDLIALLDGLGIKEKVALAGTAVGGAIALHTAFRFPERVAAVVVDQSRRPRSRRPTARRRWRASRNSSAKACAPRSTATAANGYPEELRGDTAQFAAWRARWLANDPASFAAIYRMLADMDLSPELASIKCPVLVIGGEFDRGRPPARGRADREGHSGREVQGAADRALCGLADAGADRGRDRGVSGCGRARNASLSSRASERDPASRHRRRRAGPIRVHGIPLPASRRPG